MAYARSCKSLKRAQVHTAVAKAKSKAIGQSLDMACAMIPNVAKLVGKSVTRPFCTGDRKLGLQDMRILCRAVHLTVSGSRTGFGLKHKRLVSAGRDLIVGRQQKAIEKAFESSREALASGGGNFVHMTFGHCWDEVNCRFRARKRLLRRASGKMQHQQAIVQKGSLTTTLFDSTSPAVRDSHTWLVQPQTVASTSAADLMAPILQALPTQFNLVGDLDALRATAASVTSATLVMVADKASANVLIMRALASQFWSDAHPSAGNMLVLMDSCGAHLHHRATLMFHSLKAHTSRHASMAALQKHSKVGNDLVLDVEKAMTPLFRRRVGPPPPRDGGLTLHKVVGILFRTPDLLLKSGKPTLFKQDVDDMTHLVNGYIPTADGFIYHHCWDDSKGMACCKSLREALDKCVLAVARSLFGRCDSTPCQSRWTNTLPNFKMTILRHAVFDFGAERLLLVLGEVERSESAYRIDGEDVAFGDYAEQVRQTRVARTRSYLNDDSTIG